jgi:nitronate monooxygenase
MPNRREFVGRVSTGLLSATVMPLGVGKRGAPMPAGSLRTNLCDLLEIDVPVLQAPMQAIAGPRLVAAVCEAGGMGILPGIGVSPNDLRQQITEVRSLTRRPFGVNLVLHSALRPPVDPSTVPGATVSGVNQLMNRFRERLGLAPKNGPPPAVPDILAASFDVIIDQRVAVFSTGLGLPSAEMVARCHAAGIKVMSMIATLPDAHEAERLGVDVVVAQGAEAGGHRSVGTKPQTAEHAAIGTMVLVPQVAQALKVPVVAAGGITDGRGVAAAIALGAKGVLMGTRFIATVEATAQDFHKRALVDAGSDDTTLSDAFTGHYARYLRNEYVEEYRSSGAPVYPPVLQQLASRDIVEAAVKRQIREFYPLYAGQGVGMIGNIPPAAAIVRATVEEAAAALRAAAKFAGLDDPSRRAP